jgi:hypothetical protein
MTRMRDTAARAGLSPGDTFTQWKTQSIATAGPATADGTGPAPVTVEVKTEMIYTGKVRGIDTAVQASSADSLLGPQRAESALAQVERLNYSGPLLEADSGPESTPVSTRTPPTVTERAKKSVRQNPKFVAAIAGGAVVSIVAAIAATEGDIGASSGALPFF